MSERYRCTSIWDTYLINRRRRPTSSSSPRREWWSCLCTLRCSVRSAIRLVSSAICASGDPVSVSCKPYWLRISFFCSAVSATKYLHQLVRDHGYQGAATANRSTRRCRRAVYQPFDGPAQTPWLPACLVTSASTRTQQRTRPVGVGAHGVDEVFHRVELALSPDARDEVERHMLPVQVRLGIQHECLDGAG